MNVLVCGSRNWKAAKPIEVVLYGLEIMTNFDLTLIQGCAPGADSIAEDWGDLNLSEERHLRFPAHWQHGKKCEFECMEVCGKAAGAIRNKKMLDEGKPDLVYAFTDNLQESIGTKNMVTIARKANVPVIVVGSVR